jgi:NAD(P)H-hydrate epimerase
MQSLDRRATSDFKIPSLLLMERAARGLADRIETARVSVRDKRILILAGCGNNGGDGLAAARHLEMRGAKVTVYLLSVPEQVRGDTRIFLDIWTQDGGELHAMHNAGPAKWRGLREALGRCDLIVDALLGTGLTRPVTGDYARAITLIREARQSERWVISVDIPSGISADTGEAMGTAVVADETVAMALPKRGHFTGAGLEHCGALSVVDLGFPPALIAQAGIPVDLMTRTDFEDLLPPRSKGAHKGNFGHLLVIAGSAGKGGAAQMAALAALRSGAGLVTCAMPQSLSGRFPMEIMTLPLPETEAGALSPLSEKEIFQAVEGKQALAVGPGLSLHPQQLVRNIIAQTTMPMVIDADAIHAVAKDPSVLKRKGPVILTPHPKEMGSLLGRETASVQKDRFAAASDFAQKWGVYVVLKGAHTLIAAPDGRIRINSTGNPGMATAGTGDLLTGMMGAFLAQGIPPLEAASGAVYLHGLAGDMAKQARGEVGLIASDLLENIPAVMTQIRQGESR